MLTYVKVLDNQAVEYPYSYEDLRRDNPNVSFSVMVTNDMLASYDVYPVTVLEVPEYDPSTQKIVQESLPNKIDGAWILGWSVSEKNEDEIHAEQAAGKALRILQLKQFLRDTDYVALTDYDKSKPEVLAQRQAWREEIRTLEG